MNNAIEGIGLVSVTARLSGFIRRPVKSLFRH